MHTKELSPQLRRRAKPRWVAALAVVGAMAFAPAILVAAPAFAATVTSPAEGSTGNPTLVNFLGTGGAGNTIRITYPGTAGTAVAGEDLVDADGNFDIISEFSALPPGQTTVTATIAELTPGGATAAPAVIRTFSFAQAPVAAFPFTITSPASGETVTTTTPTFTGTGNPGDTVTITYSNALAETSVAGSGVIAPDGTFSIATSFLDLTPGAVEVRTISTPTGPGGGASSATLATNIVFPVAPVPAFVPNPPAINIVPESVTVAASTSTGVQITATGFGQREELTITVAGPDGAAAVVESDTGFFADDTGSYADSLVLFGKIATGQYTVTIAGATSGLVLSDSFTVVPNPGTAGTPGGRLAATGPNDARLQGLLALAVLLTLSGAALVARRKPSPAVAD